jgi:hypothetical protein
MLTDHFFAAELVKIPTFFILKLFLKQTPAKSLILIQDRNWMTIFNK